MLSVDSTKLNYTMHCEDKYSVVKIKEHGSLSNVQGSSWYSSIINLYQMLCTELSLEDHGYSTSPCPVIDDCQTVALYTCVAPLLIHWPVIIPLVNNQTYQSASKCIMSLYISIHSFILSLVKILSLIHSIQHFISICFH